MYILKIIKINVKFVYRMTNLILLRQNVVIKYVKIVLVVYHKKISNHVQFVE